MFGEEYKLLVSNITNEKNIRKGYPQSLGVHFHGTVSLVSDV
jgi:hypothetical protein